VITIVVRNSNNGKYANGDIFVEEDRITRPSYSENIMGVPFNISSYALLTHLVAHVCGLEVGEFIHTFGDCHIYRNHLDQVEELLGREPLPLPKLKIVDPDQPLRGLEGLLRAKYEDLNLIGYKSHAKIAAPVAV